MDPRTRYATRVLERYRTLPGTLPRTLREDRNLALRLYDRGVPIQKVEDAFVLALARRTFRSSSDPIDPIRSLHYFIPVIHELEIEPPLPEYLAYLKNRLLTAGAWNLTRHSDPPPSPPNMERQSENRPGRGRGSA